MLGSLPTSPFLIEIPIRKVFRYVWGKRDCFQGRMMIDRQQHKPLSSDSMLFKKLFMMGEDGHYMDLRRSHKRRKILRRVVSYQYSNRSVANLKVGLHIEHEEVWINISSIWQLLSIVCHHFNAAGEIWKPFQRPQTSINEGHDDDVVLRTF